VYGPFDVRRGKTSPFQLQILMQKTPKQSPIVASFPYGHMFSHWPIQVYVRDDGNILKPTIVECNYIICISYLKCKRLVENLTCLVLCCATNAKVKMQMKCVNWNFGDFFLSSNA
jgi:hypothetical protein